MSMLTLFDALVIALFDGRLRYRFLSSVERAGSGNGNAVLCEQVATMHSGANGRPIAVGCA
jgi:hypothetical protein